MKKIVAVILLLTAVGAVLVFKPKRPEPVAATPTPVVQPAALPRLVDLGADKCIPCKAMAPILDELKKTYAGQLQVDFIDVWKNEGAGEQYGIRVIPTQIFFAPDGKELFRHEGFFSREDILAQWAKLGMTFKEPGAP